MREILFRGKCKDTGKWYEGYYVHLHKTTYCFKEDYDRNPDNDMHQIIFEEMMDWGLPNRHFRVDVIPETVGQYTGLTDKNGKKIFEGDIVKNDWCFMCGNSVIKFGQYKPLDMGNEYQQGHLGFYLEHIHKADKRSVRKDIMYFANNCEVIGNIHDNPELLKGE